MALRTAGFAGVALGLWMCAGSLHAQTVEQGDLTLDFTGRIQVQLNTTSVDAVGNLRPAAPASSVFETRRVRFGTGYTYGDWITGEVEADFAGGGARLTDGYIDLALAAPLRIRAGQFKKPFGVFELESSTKTRTIERGLRIRGVEDLVGVPGEVEWLLDEAGYLGRQIGLEAHGRWAEWEYAIGVFNGEGANASETAGSKAYAGRVAYGLAESLVIGGGVSVQPTGLVDGDDEVHGTAVALDATWGGFRQPGLHVMAELMAGDNPLRAVGIDPATMVGLHAVGSWFAPRTGRVEGLEPVLRLSWADPSTDSDGDHGTLITPGVNLYFNGRNRLMVNGEVYLPGQEGLDAEYAFVAQLQVHF